MDGLLHLTTPYSRVIALDPATGIEKWTYDPQVNLGRYYSETTSRRVSAWPTTGDKRKLARRIFAGTHDARLIALDAATGKPCADFGDNGQVDLKRDVRMVELGDYQNYHVTSPPAVIGDTIIVGSSIGDNFGVELERGVVRAYEARTGSCSGAGTRSRRTRMIQRERPGTARAPTALARPTHGRLYQLTRSSDWSSFLRAARAPIITAANARRQPLRELRRSAARCDRRCRLEFSGRSSRPVGLRRGVTAHADQPQAQWARRSGGGGRNEDGNDLRVGSPHWKADLSGRRAPRPANNCERRTDLGDAALPYTAAPACPATPQAGRRVGFDRQRPRRLPR
ncbi:MAG: PQQ-binding-like beta-propeller repeat protein [Chloracidobacterium sp.]|nr:PQQ-binding-like beta-propeller repeat protein [Chloracidobacterium sp.]